MPTVPATVLRTLFAMLAFAANAVFCRLALGRGAIDAASFTLLRLGSGATVLLLIHFLARREPRQALRRDWISAAALFLYAATFSLAYRDLAAGTGALLLFGSVQATMLAAGLLEGERPAGMEWLGWAAALGGLVFLVAPGLHAPPPLGAVLMAGAGVAWGVYSLRDRRTGSPMLATASNFLWAVPMGVVFWLARPIAPVLSGEGILWAVLSGAIASGVGYSIWYAALPALTATRAATVQLIVPVFAAAGGVALLHERVSLRLILATLLVLGGVALAISGRQRKEN